MMQKQINNEQMDRQKVCTIDGKMDKQMDRWTNERSESCTDKQKNKGTHADGQTIRSIYRLTDGQTV